MHAMLPIALAPLLHIVRHSTMALGPLVTSMCRYCSTIDAASIVVGMHGRVDNLPCPAGAVVVISSCLGILLLVVFGPKMEQFRSLEAAQLYMYTSTLVASSGMAASIMSLDPVGAQQNNPGLVAMSG
jgi:hypothetical protein